MPELRFNDGGWIGGIQHVRSPNYDARPDVDVNLLVIHAISLPAGHYGGPDVSALFTNTLDVNSREDYADLAGLRVSAHFFIRRTGAVIQFVSADSRAWHAGVSKFDGQTQCNDFSVGIELEGLDHAPFESEQYESLLTLARAICGRFPGITRERVAAHSDIAPGRKRDPGPGFEWSRLLGRL